MRPLAMAAVLALLMPLAGCTEEPCIDGATATAIFDQARARLDDPFSRPVTARLEGTLDDTPLALTIIADLQDLRLSMQGTVGTSPVDVRLDGAWVSMRIGEAGFRARDHAPGSEAERLLERYTDHFPYTDAPAQEHSIRCTTRDGQAVVQYVLEDGNRRDALMAERAPPHRLVAAQHIAPDDAYTLELAPGGVPVPVDEGMPRRPASLVLEQVDYQEDPDAYAFRWTVAEATWTPADEIAVAVLDANGTLHARIPLTNASTGPARHVFQDLAPTGLVTPGDVLSVAVARGFEVSLYDTWADAYVRLQFQ